MRTGLYSAVHFRLINKLYQKTLSVTSIFKINTAYPRRDMEFDDENACVTFLLKGAGHGVGLSQAGAQAMALKGEDFYDILTHYYTGASVIALKDVVLKMPVDT